MAAIVAQSATMIFVQTAMYSCTTSSTAAQAAENNSGNASTASTRRTFTGDYNFR